MLKKDALIMLDADELLERSQLGLVLRVEAEVSQPNFQFPSQCPQERRIQDTLEEHRTVKENKDGAG